jgi:dihydrofolate reductase
MARVVYMQSVSLDGFTETPDHQIDWSEKSGDMWLGGPDIAATFVRLGLIDEYRVIVRPIVLGGGTRYLPATDHRVAVRLIEPARTFPDGAVMLRYAPEP